MNEALIACLEIGRLIFTFKHLVMFTSNCFSCSLKLSKFWRKNVYRQDDLKKCNFYSHQINAREEGVEHFSDIFSSTEEVNFKVKQTLLKKPVEKHRQKRCKLCI